MLRAAADREGMALVSEVMEVTQINLVARYADILQVGARNMQNFNLLKELGRVQKPILLKRGMAATIEELLLAAGLLSLRDETDPARGSYARFRDRVMFPICSDYGDVIAFSGRPLRSTGV